MVLLRHGDDPKGAFQFSFAKPEGRLRLVAAVPYRIEVDVRRCDVVDALMIADVIVVFDEGSDLLFEISR